MTPASRCSVCGEPDSLGLAVCAACGGTEGDAADRFLYVVPATSRRDRLPLRDRIARAVGGSPAAEAVEAVSLGYRAMARVPAATAPAALEALAAQGIVGYEVPVNRSWASIPVSFAILLTLALVTGLKAGFAVAPSMLILTPLFVGVLAVSAWRGIRRPLYVARGQDRPAVPPVLVRALSELPAGEAREVVIRLARSTARVLESETMSEGLRTDLLTMLPEVAEAASDLSSLDLALTGMNQRAEVEDLPAPVIRAMGEMEAARHRLSQYLLEVVAVVGRLHGHSADSLSSAGERLSMLTAGLRGEIDAYQEVLDQLRTEG